MAPDIILCGNLNLKPELMGGYTNSHGYFTRKIHKETKIFLN
jgi:hypothetical protein